MNIRAPVCNRRAMRKAKVALVVLGAFVWGGASGCDGRAAALDIEDPEAVTPPHSPDQSPAPITRLDRSWIGRTRHEIEARLGAPVATDGPWCTYSGGVRIEYDLTLAVGFVTPVDAGVDCPTAAFKLGFPNAGAPRVSPEACEWPAGTPHRLGHSHAGRLDLATRTFEVRLAR